MRSKVHRFKSTVEAIEIPDSFTYPFNYEVHPLALRAVEEFESYLSEQTQWHEEIECGIMLGVLVVEDCEGELGFLAAFSGLLAGSNSHDYFVPPIYDMQHPSGYFREKEAEISAINREIETMENSEDFIAATQNLKRLQNHFNEKITTAKELYTLSKGKRNELRKSPSITPDVIVTLTKESSREKNYIRALKREAKEKIEAATITLQNLKSSIDELKRSRAVKSAALQEWLFKQFRVLNAKGEVSDMVEIFASTPLKTPPAGAGECAAPKLLHYAYAGKLRPVVMAEFWRGCSPKGLVRRDGEFYPSCKAKCEPILGFMLQGLKVDKNPLEGLGDEITSLEIIYKDSDMLVVNKPSGLLSVRGKSSEVSVESLIEKLYPELSYSKLVHRLDMATSGVLVVALNSDAHKFLQSQFEERAAKKHYVALLDGAIASNEGVISLPLSMDYAHRPEQMVDYENGKEAITRYKVLEHLPNGRTLVRFFPLTGRTHQLRLHSAHADGLSIPILGDAIYGRSSDRLYLHAEYLRITHPTTNKLMKFHAPSPF